MPTRISRVTTKRATSGAIRGATTATSAPPGKIASPVSSGDQPRSCCMYSVAMNWKPTQPPNSDMAARLARTREPERRMPSRTSGDAARCSRDTNAARIAAAAANESRIRAELQPTVGASTTVKTSSSTAAVIDTAPARSNDRATRAGRMSTGTSR